MWLLCRGVVAHHSGNIHCSKYHGYSNTNVLGLAQVERCKEPEALEEVDGNSSTDVGRPSFLPNSKCSHLPMKF
jgi:hypothetical protein